MENRKLDIRLSEKGRKALERLCEVRNRKRHGDLVMDLIEDGLRPDHRFFYRPHAPSRARITLPSRTIEDIQSLSRSYEISVERWIEALVRTAAVHHQIEDTPCPDISPRSVLFSLGWRFVHSRVSR